MLVHRTKQAAPYHRGNLLIKALVTVQTSANSSAPQCQLQHEAQRVSHMLCAVLHLSCVTGEDLTKSDWHCIL